MMDNKNLDIRDDEFRVIGQPPATDRRRRIWLVLALLAVLAMVICAVTWLIPKHEQPADEEVPGVFEQASLPAVVQPVEPAATFLGTAEDSVGVAYAEKLDTVINDVELSVYIPHYATPSLIVGEPDAEAAQAVLAFQAADIRADNKKILGAFVLKGEPLAWGLSKKGYCAIIDGQITVGVADDSPLFEKATETGGYFFRQYPLVDHGVLIENEPKNKTMRKALCSRNGQIFVVVSETDESFHDFTQALIDLGVENAIYLVGSHSAYGWYVDADGVKTLFAPDVHRTPYKNENYIVWK